MDLRIVSLNVARPQVLGLLHDAPVLSGIAKQPVGADRVFVAKTNIEGDGQADLSVHGGVDKAVYAYPADHWAWWESEHRLACKPGTFGENLTLEGGNETDVAIADRFRWGEALLEISQPRAPCYKFDMHAKRRDAAQILTLSARSGWYLRVIEEGHAPARDAALTRVGQSGGPSVRETFLALFDKRVSRESRLRVYETPGLAQAWRRGLESRLAATRG